MESDRRKKRLLELPVEVEDEISDVVSVNKHPKVNSDSPPPYQMKELYRKYAECMTGTDSQEYAEGADVLFSSAAAAGSDERWNPVVARLDAFSAYGISQQLFNLQLIAAPEFMAAPADGITAPKTNFESKWTKPLPDPSNFGEGEVPYVEGQLQDYPHDESSKYAVNMYAPTNESEYEERASEGQRIEIPKGRRRITV